MDKDTLLRFRQSQYCRIDGYSMEKRRKLREELTREHFARHPELAKDIDVKARIDGSWIQDHSVWDDDNHFMQIRHYLFIRGRYKTRFRPTEDSAFQNLYRGSRTQRLRVLDAGRKTLDVKTVSYFWKKAQ